MRTMMLASAAALMAFGTGVTAQTAPPAGGNDTTMSADPSAPVPPAGDQSSPMPPAPGTTDTMPGMPGASDGTATGTPMGSPASPAAPGTTGATPPMAPMTTPPPPPPRTDYPLCSKTVTDSCVNPAEARRGKRR